MDKKLTAISLFTGAGGMDVGFEAAGFNVVFANELMKEAAETYRANHPGCNMVNDDINNIFDELKNYEGVDLVFGGPPCQGFSVAGKMDPDDERSKLIFTFLDVVETVCPRFFVMENVKALGVLETFSAPSIIVAADAAAKTSLVDLIELRIARGMCGKSFMFITGEIAAVSAAIERAQEEVSKSGWFLDSSIIPNPDPKLWESII